MDDTLRIKEIAALQRFTTSLAADRRFFRDVLGFEQIGASSEALEQETRQRSAIFRSASCTLVCTEPIEPDSEAGRYLQLHPEGIGTVVFDVDDAERALHLIQACGGTPIAGLERDSTAPRGMTSFAIATPANDLRFHFVERNGHAAPLPGFVLHDSPASTADGVCFLRYDHVTLNFQTMAPMATWLERVMGFRTFWKTSFHTGDRRAAGSGSGLRSVVMWDERSGTKFALNEPLAPNFHASQISRFCDDHRGAGIQHAALEVSDIVTAVRQLRDRGVRFMSTPATYYQQLPDRLARLGLHRLDESVETLRKLEILVDGERSTGYLLQIFMDPVQPTDLHADTPSPFFFELIQRKGDNRFGEGNFRALFESIEHAQMAQPTNSEVH